MTKMTYGVKNENIDTSHFRNAICNYLMYIHGIRDDQINYENETYTFSTSSKRMVRGNSQRGNCRDADRPDRRLDRGHDLRLGPRLRRPLQRQRGRR